LAALLKEIIRWFCPSPRPHDRVEFAVVLFGRDKAVLVVSERWGRDYRATVEDQVNVQKVKAVPSLVFEPFALVPLEHSTV
jgi:hypothetical protein